tara:strand:+ start:2094 stop:2861 length:768 start_codon:yes stop_codon:yes gene_type:complete
MASKKLTKIGKELRKNILEVSYKAQAGHIPSAFSILETVYLMYSEILSDEDVFVLSKGHGCLALYAVFEKLGIISKEQLMSFSKFDSLLGGHPHRNKLKEIYASTGSLGHGLPICVGAALAKKMSQSKNKVYCLVGDGECNEGTIWESAMMASKLSLNNLVCIVDNNDSQTRSMPTTDIGDKFKTFGWNIICVEDGHDMSKIKAALSFEHSKPLCVVCNTKKGRGIADMEQNMFAWHHGPPNEEQYKKFCEELDA